jgi:hypothetical protein
MRNDPHIMDLSFPMDGLVVTLIDPWFINAHGTSFIGGTAQETIDAAEDYAIDHRLGHMVYFPFQIKES